MTRVLAISPSLRRGSLYAKPVAVISTSTSDYGALWAGESTRKALDIADARGLSEIDLAVGGAVSKFSDAGELVDEELGGCLSEVLDQLASYHKATVA